MDNRNLFLTPATYRLLRLEYAVVLAACVALVWSHLSQVNWVLFVSLFAVIDVIGYLPGHLAWRRSPSGAIPRGFHLAYNVMHSPVTATAIAGAWSLAVRPEWALLALYIHLAGDRALFGNFLKPFGVSFEPRPHPAYLQFRSHYEDAHAARTDHPAFRAGR